MEVVERISLEEIANVLKRHWLWFVVCPAVLMALLSAVSFSRTKEYRSTATLLFSRSPLVGGRGDGNPAADVQAAVGILPGLAPSRQVMQKLKRGAASRNMSADGLWNKVLHAAKGKQANIIRVSATTLSPALSRDLANAAADLAVRNYQQDYGRFAPLEERKELEQERDIAQKRLDDVKEKLVKFGLLPSGEREINDRINTLRLRRRQLLGRDAHIFHEMQNIKHLYKDAGKLRERTVKLLAGKDKDSDMWTLSLDVNKLDALLASHRALVADMLEAEGELAALFKRQGAGSALNVDAAAKTPAVVAGAQTPSGLEKIQAAKESLENEKKEILSALPDLGGRLQVSMARLKSLQTQMSDMEKARRGRAASGSAQTLPGAPGKNPVAHDGKGDNDLYGAAMAKMMDEKLRLQEMEGEKAWYRDRLARIDAKLSEQREKFREHRVKDLREKISGMRDEIKNVESRVFAQQTRIGELVLARPDALGMLSPDLSALRISPGVGVSVDEKEEMKPSDFLVNVLLKKWIFYTKILERMEQMRETRALLVVKLEEVWNSLREQWARKGRLLAQRDKLEKEVSVAQRDYKVASREYRRAIRRGASLRVIVPATLPAGPAPIYWKASATLGLVAGLFLAICAVLFLEFRKAASARKEPDGA